MFTKRVIIRLFAFSLLCFFAFSVITYAEGIRDTIEDIVEDVVETVKKNGKKVGQVVKKGVKVVKNLDIRKRALELARKLVWKKVQDWWEAQKPTLDELLRQLDNLRDETLPDALYTLETAQDMLESAQATLDGHLYQIAYKNSELGQYERDLSALRIAKAVQEMIRDDVNASPSARKSAAEEVLRLNRQIDEKIQAITDKNKEIYDYMNQNVIPARGEVQRLEWSLNMAEGHVKRTRDWITSTKTAIGEIRTKKIQNEANAQAEADRLGEEIRKIDEALAEDDE